MQAEQRKNQLAHNPASECEFSFARVLTRNYAKHVRASSSTLYQTWPAVPCLAAIEWGRRRQIFCWFVDFPHAIEARHGTVGHVWYSVDVPLRSRLAHVWHSSSCTRAKENSHSLAELCAKLLLACCVVGAARRAGARHTKYSIV